MTTTHARAVELVEMLDGAGVRAVADPRSVVPPCVLLQPPTRRYDLPLPAFTAVWTLVAIAPGPGTADAWVALDDLADIVVEVLGDLLDATEVRPASYTLPGAAEPAPALLITMTEGMNP